MEWFCEAAAQAADCKIKILASVARREAIKRQREQAHHVIYVIIGHGVINDRVEKVTSLKMKDSTIVLVTPTATGVGCEQIVVKSYPNPTAILRFLKMAGLKQMVDKFVYFPSTKILYVKAAKKVLRKRLDADMQQGTQVTVLTCVPSHDLCLLGLALKQSFPQICWIVDWQDLWSYDENYFERTPRVYRPRLLRRERQIHALCNFNITTNSRAKGVLEEVYGIPGDRIAAIPHHFSDVDLNGSGNRIAGPGQADKQSVVKIGFLGTLFKPPRVPGAIVQEALRDINGLGLRVELHVHGNLPRYATQESLARMRKDGLWFHGPSTHLESVRKLVHYDFLLVLLADLPNSRAVMSIKLPHYLSLGIPIIAIVPEPSAVADIVERTGTGYVVPINTDWRAHLAAILRGGREACTLRRSEEAVQQYSWGNLSQHWINVVKHACTTS